MHSVLCCGKQCTQNTKRWHMQGSHAPSILLQEDAQEHARLRSHFQQFFSEDNVSTVYSTLLKSVVAVATDAAKQAQNGSTAQADVDMVQLAHELISNVVLEVCTGLPLPADVCTGRLAKCRLRSMSGKS